MVEGTSFATPLVTGSVVLLQQIYESRFGTLPSVAQLKTWLQQGSDPINDPVTGITIGQLDLPKAAALIPQATSRPAPTPVTPTPVTPTPVTPTPVTITYAFSTATTAAATPTPVSTPTLPTTTVPTTSTAVTSPPVTTVAAQSPATSISQVGGNSNGSTSGSTSVVNQPSDAHSVLEALLKAMSVWASSAAS